MRIDVICQPFVCDDDVDDFIRQKKRVNEKNMHNRMEEEKRKEPTN